MALVYSCKNCEAPLVVDQRIQEILQTVPDDAEFKCRVCGATIHATDLKRKSVTKVLRNTLVLPDKTLDLPDFKSVLQRLRDEHGPGFLYRGQTSFWDGPLVPSLYRAQLDENAINNFDRAKRLRGVGSRFHQVKLSPPSSDLAQRIEVITYLNHIFGYPMGQILAQQYGVHSEGLDVTSSVEVAAVFSKYSLSKNAYLDGSSTPGVIYRFTAAIDPPSLDDLSTLDFYNCAATILAVDTLGEIPQCNTLNEAVQSWFDYKVALGCAKLDNPSAKRPLTVLRIPKEALASSRVGRQHAGLLLPDILLSRFYSRLKKHPPAATVQDTDTNAVEDIGSRAGVEIFKFVHSKSDRRHLAVKPSFLFPEKDILNVLLTSFLRQDAIGQFIFGTEFGPVAQYDGHNLIK